MNKIIKCLSVLYLFFFIFIFYNYNNDEIKNNDSNIEIKNLVIIINVCIFIILFYLVCYNIIIPESIRLNIRDTFYSFSINIFFYKYPLFIISTIAFLLLGFTYIVYLLILLRDKIFLFSSYLFMNSIIFLIFVLSYLIYYSILQACNKRSINVTENNI